MEPRKKLSPEIQGILATGVAVLGIVPFMAPGGFVLGAAKSALVALLGDAALVMLVVLGLWGLLLIFGGIRGRHPRRTAGVWVLLLWVPYVVELFGAPAIRVSAAAPGGLYGSGLGYVLGQAFGILGRDVIAILWPALGVVLLREDLIRTAFGAIGRAFATIGRRIRGGLVDFVAPEEKGAPPAPEPHQMTVMEAPEEPQGELEEEGAPSSPAADGQVIPFPAGRREASAAVEPSFPTHEGADGDFELPPVTLLAAPSGPARAAPDIQGRARLLHDTLASFGVDVKVMDAVAGPSVTRFELQPGPGVKVSRILSLSDDIALAMASGTVRIEAPIPGKSAIGIEIPNGEVAPVRLRDVLESPGFRDSTSSLAMALGKDISGNSVVAALEHMPHLLIAGATGSGKSVCLNVIILSLLFRNTPDECRLLLIDPKVVELNHFSGVPHLMAPVVTDAKKAAGALRGILRTMEDRYRVFAQAGVRDIERYNEQADEPMPKMVVVIDELADLMTVAPVEVEESICRLAQMARAAGIHLVVATQRPSVDVITGLIKANIPSRIAFAVSSQVDSRTILDQGGAEKLLGRGDMLFASTGHPKPIRAQGAYVDEDDTARVVAFLRRQGDPVYRQDIVEAAVAEESEVSDVDEMFSQAVRVVVEARQASASLLQRRLRVGYARAARLVEQMEARGFVGPQDGAKPREVRLSALEYQRLFQGPTEE